MTDDQQIISAFVDEFQAFEDLEAGIARRNEEEIQGYSFCEAFDELIAAVQAEQIDYDKIDGLLRKIGADLVCDRNDPGVSFVQIGNHDRLETLRTSNIKEFASALAAYIEASR